METTEVLRICSSSFSSPMRTVIAPGLRAAARSFRTTTCSSSASRTWRSDPGKSATLRVRFAVPPRTRRSSGCSASDSTRTVVTRMSASRSSPGDLSGSSATRAAASLSRRPDMAVLSTERSRATSSSVTTSPRSTVRWSTRPLSAISTSISRAGVSGTTSRWRTLALVSIGYWTTATCRVSCASSRTERRRTSSRSVPLSRKVVMARRSAALRGLISESRSTKRR